MKHQRSLSFLPAGLAITVLGTAIGCAAGPAHMATAAARAPGATAPAAAPPDLTAFNDLATRRQAEHGDSEYILGEGDLLTVRAFDLDDINLKVRVEGDGTITLPLLKSVTVAGRSVSEVQRELTQRLGAFMYDPHVTVFVEEYRSQQVAVQGAVTRPGLVSQLQRSATVRDTLAAAGGLTAEAGSRLYLLPAERRARDAGAPPAPGADEAGTTAEGELLAAAVMIDSHEMDADTQQRFMNLPVRPGDLIIIPNRGKFIAEGWLEKPGVYPLNPGLTVRGAIATAGGLSFPASTSIRVYHPGANGETQMRELNYRAIAHLDAPDVFIHDGDVIDVTYSTVKVVPWAFYKVVQDLFHLGAGLKVAP
jgi:polysaccharide export outer membrane protein